ncbi:uncharacterized protein LOC123881740 isoform X2 [Trifolium pratense]|uniref:uncharacterized protein LOC123881740 isoform X2 n=1 Tax=Trifolium pratense TaxID=57577 RepID=UPI001E691F15|nr:uncharacterized protein LOC123881740 isoform X2 [Trifolium pratense]XP_045786431.1 uncharacterized protein LOC123881740 isoform X2 [Trifolium pratense]
MQTIKSLTPATTVVLQWLVWMKHFDWRIGATLIPIVGGILLTSVTEMSFNMLRFCAALLAVWLHLQRLSLQNLFSMDTNLTVKMTPYEEENAKRMEALNIRHLSQSLQKSSSSKMSGSGRGKRIAPIQPTPSLPPETRPNTNGLKRMKLALKKALIVEER